MPPLLTEPLYSAHFRLDASGVAGFFGGDEAISAMATAHLYRGRRWFGWYNSPGSYTIAKRYGQLANSRWWDAVFPGVNEEPATTFGLDGKKGPKYIAAYSGTVIEQTGHIASLLESRAKEVKEKIVVETRQATTTTVTVVEVKNVIVADDLGVPMMSVKHALLACFPIIVSVATCVTCAAFHEWYSFSLILLGIMANGLSCFVFGSARVVLKTPLPDANSPPGDGVFVTNYDITVLKGEEKDVNAITKGKFVLKMRGGPEYRAVGLCSMLLVAQFVLQLLLIPQASLFGQVMFVSSLAASWMYTLYLSSLEKDKLQAELLFNTLARPQMTKFKLGSRTAAAVFTSLILADRPPNSPYKPDSRKILDSIIPNDTRMWRVWRQRVVQQLDLEGVKKFDLSDCKSRGFSSLGEKDKALLATVLHDAQQAYEGYREFSLSRESRAKDSVSTGSLNGLEVPTVDSRR
ncbi:hypothetical protein BDN67DRAFT_980247 [Paxillus ammoniavirescens]|nr:hypothetical protein BDN67DRAFT_980247 [Paxillus ammoniavirescens]